MDYHLKFRQNAVYLHAIVTGRNSKEIVVRYINDILRECTGRNCSRVLVEEHLEGPRLGMMDVFEIVSKLSAGSTNLEAMAYVDVLATGNTMHFAETVAVNRALPVHVFATVADAEKWLSGIKPPEGR